MSSRPRRSSPLIGGRWPLEPVAPAYPGEVARRYRYRDGAGEIGVIASVTQPFCRGCTRARLSADGKLYTCLFAGAGHDLRGPLRAGASDQALRAADRRHLDPAHRPLLRAAHPPDQPQEADAEGGDVAHRRLTSLPVTGEGPRASPGGQRSPRRWSRPMTYVIAEPCIDVKDKACIEECPSIVFTKASGCSTSTPAIAPTAAPANGSAGWRRSSATMTSPGSGLGSPRRTPGCPAG